MKYIKYFLLIVFVFSCTPKNIDEDQEGREDRPREISSGNQNGDNDKGDDEDYREQALRRLKNNSTPVIRSFLESKYSKPSYDYTGGDCGDLSSCRKICDNTFSSSYRRRCASAPAEFIENLEEDLFKLINISDIDEVDISPAFITAALDFDEDLLSDLIEENMSEGDLKSFLAWIAVNKKVATAFENDRSSRKILEKAFEKLGDFNKGSKELETGFNVGLIDEDDTFLFLASDEGNEKGFVLGYKILDDSCSSKNCKLSIFCSREEKNLSRSKIFSKNRRDSNLNCKTSTTSRRRSRSGQTCYIQGASVWSFLEELIDDDEINDSDFKSSAITVNVCTSYCGEVSKTNKKCGRIL